MRGQESSLAEVAVEAPLTRTFHYRVPDGLLDRVIPGARLKVPFGRRTVRGVCLALTDEAPIAEDGTPIPLKDIVAVTSDGPAMSPDVLDLARWVSDYYAAPIGEALAAAAAGSDPVGRRPLVVELAVEPDEARTALDGMGRAKKRRLLIEMLLDAGIPVPLPALSDAGISRAVINSTRDLGLVRYAAAGAALPPPPSEEAFPFELSADQRAAIERIVEIARSGTFGSVLLNGVTGSGKTEVYLEAMRDVVARGRQAIVLVPEIALTPQTVARFSRRFSSIAVLHSALPAGERHAAWEAMRSGSAQVAIGARSAVFAPAADLGIIVVDEEHEPSFKQDTSPRYSARDAAVVRAYRLGIPVVLGSATPSLESFRNAQRGRYLECRLPSRVAGGAMPRVDIVDMSREVIESKGRAVVLSRTLEKEMREAIGRGEQVMLYLNRRGHSTLARCARCGFVLKCADCDVSMTLHKARRAATCHYCGREITPPSICPGCNWKIAYHGTGTERVEEIVGKILPETRVERMDSDATRTRGSHERILGEFDQGATEVLVGTQMIAKGHHFPNVTVVGIVSADVPLALPDFRAAERTFQLICQMAGRAGRGERPGRVIVQTCLPEHYAITTARTHDYGAFAEKELAARKALGYPPFSRLVRVVVEDEDRKVVAEAAREAAGALRAASGSAQVLGPAECPLAKIRGRRRWQVLAKCFSEPVHFAVAAAARDFVDAQKGRAWVDVDPLSML